MQNQANCQRARGRPDATRAMSCMSRVSEGEAGARRVPLSLTLVELPGMMVLDDGFIAQKHVCM